MSKRNYNCVFKKKFKQFNIGACANLRGGFTRYLASKNCVTVLNRNSNAEDTVQSNILAHISNSIECIKSISSVTMKCKVNQVGLLYESVNLSKFLQFLKSSYDIDLDSTSITCKLNGGVVIKLFGSYSAEFVYNGVVQHKMTVNVTSS